MVQPLLGKEILITRDQSQSKRLAEMVTDLDGIPVEIPLLKISCSKDSFHNFLTDYQWIIFTSANGVHCFFNILMQQTPDMSYLSSVQFAVVGQKTEKALNEYGFQANFIPSIFTAEALADELLNQIQIKGNLLIVKGNKSLSVLQNKFRSQDVPFEELEIYETKRNEAGMKKLQTYFSNHTPDFITFTSPSAVDAFIEADLEEVYMETALSIPCVCIGTTTEKHANDLGFRNTLIPDQFTIEGMIKRIVHYIKEKG
ncbi:uroporphyrinogen-III synthase [Virgibacillus flavescens]|uniref:uroporphyrinogen-III synthase n=1 Tax=Virgibacillus flavescens TaxID=1611422 RepID=UPI003D338F48